MTRSFGALVVISAGAVCAALLGSSCQKNEGAVIVEDAAGSGSETFVSLPEAGPSDEIDFDTAVDVAPSNDAAIDLAAEKSAAGLPNGERCQDNGSCSSKFCVDGVCCDSACEAGEAVRCNACSMARTGQKDGLCAPDSSHNKMKCGETCGEARPNVPGIVAMVCIDGRCAVSPTPMVVATCGGEFVDPCATNSCVQATVRTATCKTTLCPQAGDCCCALVGNASQRMCLSRSLCTNGRACATQ